MTDGTEYPILDASGTPVAIHRRIAGPDGKRFTWELPDGTTGLGGFPVVDLPLYGVHRAERRSVIVCEGEKAAQALMDAGMTAVGTVTGAASSPSPKALSDLAGKVAFLWPDNDDPGRAHMAKVATSLAPIAASVQWIEPPSEAPKGWDAADAMAEGGRELVEKLVRGASPWADKHSSGPGVGTPAQVAAVEPPRLAVLDEVDMPEVPEEEQRRLAGMMADGLREPDPWRTLADVSDDPPRPLLLGILEPDGPTLMYAPPGVGKDMTGAWTIIELQKLGMKPAIYDAERRPREWARRVAGLSGDRSGVVYIEPVDLGSKYAGRPLWEAAPVIGAILEAAGADLLLVDSVLPAVGVGEERLRSDAQAPFLYVSALDSLGIPSVSFGHPPKGQPEGDPFGSMAWLAAMRLTWSGTRAEGSEHRVRWRPRKRNERGHLGGILLTFAYGDDGRPCSVTREDDDESTRDWLLAALIHGPRSVADLADEIAEESDEHVTVDGRDRLKERLGKSLRRMANDGSVVKEGERGRGVRWSLRWAG